MMTTLMILYKCIGWHKHGNGYSDVLLVLYVICDTVKSWCVLCGWLVSLTWCMYECDYDMSWLRMLSTISLVCMNGMRPLMFLRGSFMWNLEPSGRVMNLDV